MMPDRHGGLLAAPAATEAVPERSRGGPFPTHQGTAPAAQVPAGASPQAQPAPAGAAPSANGQAHA